MAVTAVFESTQSRVRLGASGLGAATWATFWSRRAGAATWNVVRGAWRLPVTGGVAPTHYDPEFPVVESLPGSVQYLMQSSAGASEQTSVTCSVVDQCWLKFPGFPFLNRRLVVTDRGSVGRDSRGSLLPIVSQRAGIAVQEHMSGLSAELTVRTDTWQQWRDLDAAVSLGAIVWLHADEAALGVPAMYATVSSVKSEPGPRRGGGSQRRYTSLTLTQCATPGYLYAGSVGTWATVLNSHATWQGLLDTYPTWLEVAAVQGSAADVVVS